MKIGIVQMPMSWQLATNMDFICQVIKDFAHLDVLVFPELAVTGFHRKLREVTPADLSDAMATIQACCAACGVLVFLGHPIWQDDAVYNGFSGINEHGELAVSWAKVGLTDSEKTFFTAGAERDVFAHELGRFNAFICREANDHQWFINEVKGQKADVIFWPSYIGLPPVGQKSTSPSHPHFDIDAAYIALVLNAFVIQCNWPQALNTNEAVRMGDSKVIAPCGKVLHQLPTNVACVGVFDTQSLTLDVKLFEPTLATA